jgi:predicted CXXCH cytochrome family protein
MKRGFLFLGPMLVVLGALLLWPRGAEPLNPNHQCSYCHTLHLAPGTTLLNNTVVETLCLTCHGPGGISTLKADVHTNRTWSQYPPFRISCRGCHDPHSNRTNWFGGTNLKLVGTIQDSTRLARILTPNSGIREVVFESRGSDVGQPTLHSFADADQDRNGYYDGICETCHTLTRNHRNNPSGNHYHNTGRTCTKCHEHIDHFLPYKYY